VKDYPYWWDTIQSSAPSAQSPAPSRLPSDRVDVAVIGAGYTGLSAARHLARAGASVIVLERERVGWGASSRNAGQVLTGLRLDPAALVKLRGEARARQMFDSALTSIDHLEAVIAGESIQCGYTRTGHVEAAAKPKHFEEFKAEQALLAKVFGHRVELVGRAEQRTELGTDAYHGLMVDERSGALNPAQYCAGLADAATRAGVKIVEIAARHIEKQPEDWLVSTIAGGLHAREVLLATNGYTNAAAPALQRRIVPIGSYIIVTDPLLPAQAAEILPRGRMAFDSKNFLHYFRLTADRRLLFGGRAEFSQPDPATTRRAASLLRAEMVRVFPFLDAANIAYAWGGNVGFTRDQLPHAGLLEGAHYAAGYCGHGVAMATYLGEQIARRLTGEPIDNPFFDDRFKAIPLYRGEPWFLPLVGMYYRMKDRWQ
jgi:glycine/D-amino acid oxidase-like deaminating enzyme